MLEFDARQDELFLEAIRAGDLTFEPESLPDQYSTDKNYPDKLLFAKLYDTIEAARSYPEKLENVIDRAGENLQAFDDMGVSADTFAYRFQRRVAELYAKARADIQITPIYTRGWNEFFDDKTTDIFIFILLIMLASVVFTQETRTGSLQIIRAAR